MSAVLCPHGLSSWHLCPHCNGANNAAEASVGQREPVKQTDPPPIDPLDAALAAVRERDETLDRREAAIRIGVAERDRLFSEVVKLRRTLEATLDAMNREPSRAQMRAALEQAHVFVQEDVCINVDETMDERCARISKGLDLDVVILAALGRVPT